MNECKWCERLKREVESLRRRGVEGLSDAKALLTEIRHELLRMDGGHGSIAELPASLRRASTVARLSNAIRALDAALAPRDSVPVTENDVAASCFGVAPRDSGKVFSSADEPFADLVTAKARK